MLLLSGCSVSTSQPSSDIDALRTKIVLDLPATGGKWEIFGTPEDTGGLPGPTDFVTLIAEFEHVSPAWLATQKRPAGRVWVAPESPRPWLSPAFKVMLKSASNHIVNLTDVPHCHAYSTQMHKSGRVVEGFMCSRDNKVLVYLTLRQPGT